MDWPSLLPHSSSSWRWPDAAQRRMEHKPLVTTFNAVELKRPGWQRPPAFKGVLFQVKCRKFGNGGQGDKNASWRRTKNRTKTARSLGNHLSPISKKIASSKNAKG